MLKREKDESLKYRHMGFNHVIACLTGVERGRGSGGRKIGGGFSFSPPPLSPFFLARHAEVCCWNSSL